MTKITAIHSGGDWADASADYLVLPAGMDLTIEKRAYDAWYRDVYAPVCYTPQQIEFLTLAEWCLQRGARHPDNTELDVVDDCY